MDEGRHAGFRIRTGAALIDTILVFVVLAPAVTAIYGADYWTSESVVVGPLDFLLNFVLPAVVVIAFWIYRSATPGKMLTKLTIVDAKTGGKPSTGQFVIRYLGYYVSMIPLFLGLIWVGFDKRKQGWHDKMAGTLVMRDAPRDRGKLDV